MSIVISLLLPDESADRIGKLVAETKQTDIEIISNALRLYEAAVFKKDGEIVGLRDGKIVPIFEPA